MKTPRLRSDRLGKVETTPWQAGTAFMTVGFNCSRRGSTLQRDKVVDTFNLHNYPPSFRERELRRTSYRSELIGANRYFGDDLGDTGDPVGLQSFGYAYDNIGNRTSVTNSGDVTSYSPNNLNQYTQRQISNLINLRGSAETGATVTVKMGSSQSESVTRQDKYWHKQLTSTNDTEAQYPLIKVVGVAKNAATNGDDIVTIETGHVFVAKTPEQFTYDEDGNLLSDGRWTYSWNGENRLVSMETATNKVGTTVPVVRLEFVYDYQGRRVSKSVSQWVSNQWDEISDSTFIYDGFNLVREVEGRTVPGEPSCETNVNYFVFGLDLSGSLQGAGGVGGLLAEIDDGEVYFPCFDANGNVSEYVSTNGTIVAHREYSPYGKTLVSSGTKKSEFTHWFSTKPFDQRSGLYSYIFRYYDPDLSRWLSRDPLGERGGLCLYVFVVNAPTFGIDDRGAEFIFQSDKDDLKRRAEQLFDNTVKNVDDDLAMKLQAAMADPFPCKINVLIESDVVLIANFSSQVIDLADIEEFATSSEVGMYLVFAHEMIEQWEKQKNGVAEASVAHRNTNKIIHETTGIERIDPPAVMTKQGWSLFGYYVYDVILVTYRRIKVDKDGVKVLEEIIQEIREENGNVTEVRESSTTKHIGD